MKMEIGEPGREDIRRRLDAIMGIWRVLTFSLTSEDAQCGDHWRLKMKGEVVNPGLVRKWLLK